MPSKKEPVFRKAANPWYRSNNIYCIALVCMLVVFLFSIAGISVARGIEVYRGYLWVPITLASLSAIIFITTVYRLIKRLSTRTAKGSFLSD